MGFLSPSSEAQHRRPDTMIIIELNSGLPVCQEMGQSQQLLMTAQGDESCDYHHCIEEGNEAQRDGVVALRWEGEAGQELWSAGPKAYGLRRHHGLVQD